MNKIKFFSLTLIFVLFIPTNVFAICPACTVAAGVGVGLSRWLGIDDIISGIWIGGVTLSSALWLFIWLKKKISFKFMKILILGLFYLAVILPLYFSNIMGNPYNTIFGIDSLFAGIVFGSLIFYGGIELHNLIKRRNNNQIYFPFQKVIIPVLFLILGSVVFQVL
jgi:hypothetical protein